MNYPLSANAKILGRADVLIMKIAAILLFFVFVCSATAQQYSGFFRYDSGVRVDFSEKNPKGEVSEDTMPRTAVLHILIPTDGKSATVSLAYGKGAEGREDQSYGGIVVHRTDEMITIVCGFGGDVDKIETIVLFPSKKAGFVMAHSAYFGRGPLMKKLAESKPEVPFGSASILRLQQFEK